MEQYLHLFHKYIEENTCSNRYEEPQRIVELLYDCYTEVSPIDTEEIRNGFAEINETIRRLTVEENDRIFAVVCQLCSLHERLAFIEGLRVGAQFMMELKM